MKEMSRLCRRELLCRRGRWRFYRSSAPRGRRCRYWDGTPWRNWQIGRKCSSLRLSRCKRFSHTVRPKILLTESCSWIAGCSLSGGEGSAGNTYSHTALSTNLQVLGSQHLLPAHWATPPQSQSSPFSTIPLPHSCSVIIVTPLFEVRQDVSTPRRPIAEQMLPTVHGLKSCILSLVLGFIMNFCPASHSVADSGQHCEVWGIFVPQLWDVQSCTAPIV